MKDDIYYKARNLPPGSKRSLAIGRAGWTKIKVEQEYASNGMNKDL
jgi:hypothetical protein